MNLTTPTPPSRPRPTAPAPPLEVDLVGGGRFVLAGRSVAEWNLEKLRVGYAQVAVNSMPAIRPRVEDLVGAIRFFVESDYPPRGEA